MTSRQLLEIDSSILEKNLMLNEDLLNIPDDPLNLLSSQAGPEFKLVKPTPGFCIKFKLDNDQKAFINVCHTEEIPEPRDITEEKLAEIIECEDICDFKIPMSIGDPHEEVDRSGGPVTAYDVAINSKFFAKIKDSKSFNYLFLMIAIEGVENKYKVQLNNDYTCLINRKCLGNLQYHRIRQTKTEKPVKKKKCLIEEIPSNGTSIQSKQDTQSITGKKKSIQEISTAKKAVDTKSLGDKAGAEYRVMELDVEGRKFYVIEVHLPHIISSEDLFLHMGEDRLLLKSKKGSTLVDTFFKLNVKQTECLSQFNTKCQVLTITVPVA